MKDKTIKIAVLASGRGSNLQAIFDAIENKQLNAEIVVVISDNSEAFALKKAADLGVSNYFISKKGRDIKLLKFLKKHDTEILVLAGYLKKIGSNVLDFYRGKVINIHPSLLPKFGGPGMYGLKVHQAVIAAGEKISGATVHLVTEEYDKGPILAQMSVAVELNDTAESLAARVLITEHILLVQALKTFLEGLDD